MAGSAVGPVDVAVVGYGPVGMAMAALLGRAGHRVLVVERYGGLYQLPRAAIFDDETMRTFAQLGVAEDLLPRLHVQRNYEWRSIRSPPPRRSCSSSTTSPRSDAAAGPSGT